jgi:hypothetical protein
MMIQTLILAQYNTNPGMAAFTAMLRSAGGLFHGMNHEQVMECFFLYTSVAIHKRYDPQPRPEMFPEVRAAHGYLGS